MNISNIDFILDKILPYIPLELEDEGYLSKWIHRKYDNTIQRSCVEIIHKANKL
ncbi:MAG: hypothetical protein V8S33_14750 [Intestinibacter bartlettii]